MGSRVWIAGSDLTIHQQQVFCMLLTHVMIYLSLSIAAAAQHVAFVGNPSILNSNLLGGMHPTSFANAMGNSSVTVIVLVTDVTLQQNKWDKYGPSNPLQLTRNVTITSMNSSMQLLNFNFMGGYVMIQSGISVTFKDVALAYSRCAQLQTTTLCSIVARCILALIHAQHA